MAPVSVLLGANDLASMKACVFSEDEIAPFFRMARGAAPPIRPLRLEDLPAGWDREPSRTRARIGRIIRWFIIGAVEHDAWLDRRAVARLRRKREDAV